MRFVITKEWRQNQLLRLILGLFLLFAFGFWLTQSLLFFQGMSLQPQSIIEHYLGKKDAWGGPPLPRSYKVMLEVSHAHLAMMGLWLLTLTHLLLFVPIAGRIKAIFVFTALLSGLFDECAGWLIRFVHPSFAFFKIATFLALQISTLCILVLVAMSIAFHWRNAYRDPAPHTPP